MVCKQRGGVADYTKPCRRADIAVIRTEYRVCGTLLGTLPHLSQQNVFLGVPLVLQPEEAVFLVDKGMCLLLTFRTSSYEVGQGSPLSSMIQLRIPRLGSLP